MKGRSIAEAVTVFMILQGIMVIPQGIRSLVRWENRVLGGSYFTGVLMIVLAMFTIIFRRYEFKAMGISPDDWKSSLGYGLRGYLFFIIPQIAISFFQVWGLDYRDFMVSAVVVGLLILVMTVLMNRVSDVQGVHSGRLILIPLLLASPFILSFVFDRFSTRLLNKFIWNILVGGFTEEFFYRGFIQSSINQEYGKKWKIGETKYGPGLLIASLLFGLSRGLRISRPGRGIYSVSWSWTFFSFTVGIFYGLIREKTGDIIGSGSANSLIDAIGVAFSHLFS